MCVYSVLSGFRLVRLFVIPWTVACQAPLSMRVSEQDYWSALLLLSPRELPEPGIDPTSPASPVLQADSLPLSHLGSPTKYNDTALIQFSLVYKRTQDYNL